ncbi:hypothetical protein U9M48_007779 [Paspalum notatum var. saurae]|uniref:Uncharacterized protein n=1 Tax=Paspalum notatum var. saurae TaxID=547442 RepID=A0AAQ3WC42_PASNO
MARRCQDEAQTKTPSLPPRVHVGRPEPEPEPHPVEPRAACRRVAVIPVGIQRSAAPALHPVATVRSDDHDHSVLGTTSDAAPIRRGGARAVSPFHVRRGRQGAGQASASPSPSSSRRFASPADPLLSAVRPMATHSTSKSIHVTHRDKAGAPPGRVCGRYRLGPVRR